MKPLKAILSALLCLTLAGCGAMPASAWTADSVSAGAPEGILDVAPASWEDIPEYSGKDWIAIDGNIPGFDSDDLSGGVYEAYSGLDSLGRCGVVCALLGPESLPAHERGDISVIEPSGWSQVFYDSIDGEAIYNRSHLLMFALGGSDDSRNLITGTRHMNASVMLDFETEVLGYIETTGNRVLYRVTPIFFGDELVARGVQMEALSVEDDGESVCFNVFCYNVQPGIEIDYMTGESRLVAADLTSAASQDGEPAYILNTNSMRFHEPFCESVSEMSDRNKESFFGSREEALELGYKPCGSCKP